MDSIIEARQRRLESGCQAIEAFARQIDKESSVSASICKKEVLLGKFLMEICDYEKYDDSKSSQTMNSTRRELIRNSY